MLFKVHSSGPEVAEIQALLNQFAAKESAPTRTEDPSGVFGPHTEAAVIAFQRARSLTVDGIVGPKTFAELRSVTGAAPAVSRKSLDEVVRDKLLDIVSKFEGTYWTLNLDQEFEGAFDQPARDAQGAWIPPAERSKRNAWSKFGDDPGHVGLSFGFVQFTQDGGNLGALLGSMLRAEPARFREIFGPQSDDLVRVTTLKGPQKRVPDAGSKTGVARRSPRVAPVGGADLWQPPWIERFTAAGKEPLFQNVQRREAERLYFGPMLRRAALPFDVRSEKGLCVLLDRTVQLGPAGCAKLLERAWPTATRALDEPRRFAILSEAVQKSFWAHRVRKLLERNDLSYDVQFDDVEAVASSL